MSSKVKPTLTGQKIRSRKRDEKHKYEPERFRNAIVAGLSEAGDLDEAAKFLDQNSKLDYRRYAESLFDILIAGGLLAPGGSLEPLGKDENDEDEKLNPLCVFSCGADKDEDIKEYAVLLQKLTRRFKYLTVHLGEEIIKVIKFLKGYETENREKLAKFTGYLLAMGMIKADAIGCLDMESLVKSHISSEFALTMFKVWLREASIQAIATAMKKAQLETSVLTWWPQNEQNIANFKEECEKKGGLDDVVSWQTSQQTAGIKRETHARLKEMYEEEESDEAMMTFLKETQKNSALQEEDIMALIWQSMMETEDWSKNNLQEQCLRRIKENLHLMLAFSDNHYTQVNLLARVQSYCYDNQDFMKYFKSITLLLYKGDVVGEDAVLEWYDKGHLSKGKTVFLEEMKDMVEWLRNAEEESSDEEDED